MDKTKVRYPGMMRGVVKHFPTVFSYSTAPNFTLTPPSQHWWHHASWSQLSWNSVGNSNPKPDPRCVVFDHTHGKPRMHTDKTPIKSGVYIYTSHDVTLIHEHCARSSMLWCSDRLVGVKQRRRKATFISPPVTNLKWAHSFTFSPSLSVTHLPCIPDSFPGLGLYAWTWGTHRGSAASGRIDYPITPDGRGRRLEA